MCKTCIFSTQQMLINISFIDLINFKKWNKSFSLYYKEITIKILTSHHFLTYNFVREFHSIIIIYFDFDDLSNEANQMNLKIASINKNRRSFKYKKIQFNSITFKNCTKNIKLYNENISLWNLCTIWR